MMSEEKIKFEDEEWDIEDWDDDLDLEDDW